MLVLPKGERSKKGHSRVSEDDLFVFLKERVGKLEGIVITGGEPTLHRDLPEFIKKIKDLGFKIKLDTNGTNPEMLKKLLPLLSRGGKRGLKGDRKQNPLNPPLQGGLIDYIAMDIKAPLEKYGEVVGLSDLSLRAKPPRRSEAISVGALNEIASSSRGGTSRNDNFVNLSNIQKSIKIIIESNLPYEFRTTLVPGLHTLKDIKKMGALVKGADKWYLQQFKSDTDLVNSDFQKLRPFTDKEIEKMRKIGEKFVKECEVR